MPKGKPAKSKSQPTPTPEAAPRHRRRPLLIIALAAVTLALAIAGVYAGRHLQRSAHLAESVPENVGVFVELPSVERALGAMGAMKILDASKASPKQTAEGAVDTLAEAFHLEKDDAKKLAASLLGVAFAARPTATATPHVWLAAVSSPDPVMTLLESSRFKADGDFHGSAKAYRLAPGTPVTNAPLLEEGLLSLQASAGKQRVVWFPTPRILAIGDETLLHDIGDVLGFGKPALEQKASFQLAKKRAQGDDGGFVFADEEALKGSSLKGTASKFLEGYFHDGGAIGGAVRFTPAGIVVSASAPLSGDGLPKGGALAPVATLTLPERLPQETAFYLAASTKHTSAPEDARRDFLSFIETAEPDNGFEMARNLAYFQHELGFPLNDLFEMAGDEAVLALLVDKDFKYGASTPLMGAGLKWVGAAFVMKVDGDAAAQRVLVKLREAIEHTDIGQISTVTPESDGFSVVVSTKTNTLVGGLPPGLRVRYSKKEIAVVVGRPDMMKHTFAALDGDGPLLKNDAAHTLAMSSMRHGARAYAWLDMGRVASTAFTASPEARESARGRGMPVDSINLTGPNRVTTAIAFDLEQEGGAWMANVETLNLWAAGFVIAWHPVGDAQAGTQAPTPSSNAAVTATPPPSAIPTSSATPPNPTSTPSPRFDSVDALTDMPLCVDVLKGLEVCASKAKTPEAHDAFIKDEADKRATYARTPPGTKRMFANKACIGPLFKLGKDPACK